VDALEAFAANLRRVRETAGLTQERLAELADLHMTDVGRIERGERDPGVKTVVRLAK
jgi:transcriptional regulator with XRE-family HTH domain